MEFTLAFIKLFMHAIALASPLLIFFILTITVIGLIAGRKESWKRMDSLYWAFITATTVGYGDIRPTQKLTKILSILIAFTGLIFTGIVVALAIHAATTAFSQHSSLEQETTVQRAR